MSKAKEKNKLTKKQEMFCRFYVSNGHNGKQAAISAGYSKKTAKVIAMENLTKPYLKEFIEELEQPVLDELGISEDWVLTKLKNYSETNIDDFFDVVDGKLTLKDLSTLTPDKISAVEFIQQDKDGGIKIKLINKRACVVDIGKHFGMFKNVIDANIHSDETKRVYVVPAFNKNKSTAADDLNR